MTKTKQVLISHATADARFAHRLADDLRRLGVQVWIAPESIRPGESWVDAIERGLEESSHTVIVLTPKALKSRWVKKETGVAIAQERKGRIRVIPLDVEPCAVPLLLSSYQMVSFRHDYDAGLRQLADILDLRVTPSEPVRPPYYAPPHGTVPEAMRPAVKEEPVVRGGLPIWGWGVIALVAALAIGGLIFLATQGGKPTTTPVPVAQAATPTATATAIATPMPTTDTPTSTSTPTPVPPTATPVVPTLTDTPLPPSNTPTNTPTDTPTLVSPTDTPPPVPLGMVYVPAGEFIMGSSDSEVDYALQLCKAHYRWDSRCWFEDEQPVHTAYLDAFYIDKYEVTNAQYRQCVEAGACSPPHYTEGWLRSIWGIGYKDYDEYNDPNRTEHPVVDVDWNQASAYCQWAGKRLPTEAEWEKAARSTDGRMYPWGNTFDGGKANFCDKNCPDMSSDASVDDGYTDTAPVGSYPAGASPYGALDMAGDVLEWVADWYDEGYYSRSPTRNPLGPNSGEYKVLRGGSWNHPQGYTRCASRLRITPEHSANDVGFRCARGAE